MLVLDSGDDSFNVTTIKSEYFSGELYEYVDYPDDAKTFVWQDNDRNVMFHITAHGTPEQLLSYAVVMTMWYYGIEKYLKKCVRFEFKSCVYR